MTDPKTFGLKVVLEFLTIVDSTIHRQTAKAISADERLLFLGGLGNGLQEEIRQADRPACPVAYTVRSTVLNCTAHLAQKKSVCRPPV
jgi:hypothetical protein